MQERRASYFRAAEARDATEERNFTSSSNHLFVFLPSQPDKLKMFRQEPVSGARTAFGYVRRRPSHGRVALTHGSAVDAVLSYLVGTCLETAGRFVHDTRWCTSFS